MYGHLGRGVGLLRCSVVKKLGPFDAESTPEQHEDHIQPYPMASTYPHSTFDGAFVLSAGSVVASPSESLARRATHADR